jgi:hypothetical protein
LSLILLWKLISFFQFSPSILICHVLMLSIWSLYFWFFFSWPFNKSFIVFNFTVQSKLIVYYLFHFVTRSFDFFFFIFLLIFFIFFQSNPKIKILLLSYLFFISILTLIFFNCYFLFWIFLCNCFSISSFNIHFLGIELHNFFMYSTSSLMIRVTSLKN